MSIHLNLQVINKKNLMNNFCSIMVYSEETHTVTCQGLKDSVSIQRNHIQQSWIQSSLFPITALV